MAESTTVSLPDSDSFKVKALQWANHFKTACLLDSNSYPHKDYKSKDWMLAIDAVREMHGSSENAFEDLQQFRQEVQTTIFGFFSYDLKNQIEKLSSNNYDGIKFPDMYFFQPRYLFEIAGDKLTVNRNYPETFHLIELISEIKTEANPSSSASPLPLHSRTPKKKYLENVAKIQKQIEAGDYYELNYCNEFYAEGVSINPVEVFIKLNDRAKTPFSCFFKLEDKFLLSASPERFLKKEGNELIAQPIKGTIKKGKTTEENRALQLELQNDAKERAENIMIVDLMRNDLSKSSKVGSVRVKELCGIYEFTSVNQMISTICSQIDDGVDGVDAIKNAFPMGSMTGAPKVEVMENIERYEDARRGLYSGAVGYIDAKDDFDFNVVIRSILYNSTAKYLSIQVGGAITFYSVPEKEYQEILLKAKGLVEVLEAQIPI
jgi:para-aminobenzoate synthetase component 1